MFDLSKLTIEELGELKRLVEKEIEKRKNETSKEYEFDFEYENDPRKGVPYAAKLVWNKENKKIERIFFDLEKIYGKKNVLVHGKFKAKEGEIIEIRKGGSWKNDYRSWYVVHDAQLVKVADIDSASQKLVVEKYLKGDITLEELLQNK